MKKIEGRRKQSAVPGMSLVDLRSDVPRLSLAVKAQGAQGLTCSFQCRLAEVLCPFELTRRARPFLKGKQPEKKCGPRGS
jgi:hypothetical protein